MASQLVKLRNIKRALSYDPAKLVDHGLNSMISGRIRTIRTMKSVNFVDLIDGSTAHHLQVVIKKSILKKPEIGSYIICEGLLAKSQGTQQAVEFKVDKVLSSSRCDPEKYPLFTNDRETKDGWYRRYLHLRPQNPHFASLLRVRSELELSLHMIMKQMDFFRVHTPILTSNDSETSSNLFKVERRRYVSPNGDAIIQEEDQESDSDEETTSSDLEDDNRDSSFFNRDVFLTTSAQLHLESLAASLSRVYTISNTFRAENSFGPRHLCEFTMFEAEEANVLSLEQLITRVESIVKFVAQYISEVSEHKMDLLSLLERHCNADIFNKLSRSEFIHMKYSEAIEILKKKLLNERINFGKDINKTHERILLKYCDNVPIFITDYPQELKPFYMKLSENCEPTKTVACFDLIAPIGGEICGGSIREDDIDILKSNIAKIGDRQINTEKDLVNKKIDWYLQLREFGSFPHAGFGMGLERLLKAMTGINNIRDTTAFPRWPGKCDM